jgi:hypothetical protein
VCTSEMLQKRTSRCTPKRKFKCYSCLLCAIRAGQIGSLSSSRLPGPKHEASECSETIVVMEAGGRRRRATCSASRSKSAPSKPMTGFFRDGCCNTGPQDVGSHTVCVVMTAEFLEFSKSRGNVGPGSQRIAEADLCGANAVGRQRRPRIRTSLASLMRAARYVDPPWSGCSFFMRER